MWRDVHKTAASDGGLPPVSQVLPALAFASIPLGLADHRPVETPESPLECVVASAYLASGKAPACGLTGSSCSFPLKFVAFRPSNPSIKAFLPSLRSPSLPLVSL